MNFFDKIPISVYKILIVLATVIWGYAFVGMKFAIATISPNWMVGIRFSLAGVILSAIVFKTIKQNFCKLFVLYSLALGFLEFLAFSAQTIGLYYTTPGINAFLTAAYCVITPFFAWFLFKKKPGTRNFVAAFMALGGIWLVSVSGDSQLSIGIGEILSFVCAFFFAAHIVLMSKATKIYNAIALSAAEFVCEGIFGIIAGAIFEPTPSLSDYSPDFIGLLVFLVIFSTIICFGIQNISLAYVPPSQASLLLSLECVFGVIFSVLIYGEVLSLRMVFGFVLIFAGIIISEYESSKKKPSNKALKVNL